MEHLWTLIQYVRDNPRAMVGAAVVLGVLYWLVNRKPKLQRDAEKRIEEIREERGDPYRKTRPLN